MPEEQQWERVHRIDLSSGTVGERRRTQQGGLIARANLTRTGVFEYRQQDGTVRRELRHPDEVFDKDSMASLAHATLTDDHPERVHPGNFKQVTIGHVAGTPKREGDFLASDIHVQDAEGIRKAETGKLQELSCGYECSLDPTPGEYNGEKYDAIQRKIRYNHVAAGPAGWGRAGPQVRMHLDSRAGVSGLAESPARSGAYVSTMADVVDERISKLEKEIADAKKRADTLEAENSTLKGENASLKTRTDKEDNERRTIADRARSDAQFSAHIDAIDDARRFLGPKWDRKDASGQLKSVEAIHREVLTVLKPKLKLDNCDANFIKGAYTSAVADAEEVQSGFEDTQFASYPGMNRDGKPPWLKGGKDDPSDDDEDPETKKAADNMIAKQKDAWKSRGRDSNNRTVSGRGAFGGGNQGNAAGGFGGGMGGS